MKKFFGFITALSVFLASSTAFAGVFPDVAEDHENYKSIEYMKKEGYISGYSDLTFRPDNEINRSEAVKIIVSALNIPYDGDYLVLFGDVPEDQWYFPYVMGAHEAGIVSGGDDGKFNPGRTINLAESLKIVSEALDVDVPQLAEGEKVFADVGNGEWYANYALYARDKNIVLMDDYGMLNAGDPMTRADFAEIMYRFLIVDEADGTPFPLDDSWDYYESGALPFKVKWPGDWDIFSRVDGLNEVVFWKNDKGYYQFSPERIYPNTSKFVVSLDLNEEGLSKSEYFSNIKKVFASGVANEFGVGDYSSLEILYEDDYIKDWYIYLDSGQVLVVYTQNGSGVLAYQNRKFLDAMLGSFEHSGASVEVSGSGGDEDLKSNIFQKILVEGEGQDVFGMLSDEYIVETDSIGVGTGPIDYYYSAEVDLTFKYERAGDVILDYREGQTTTF
jgi:hypothetical protein